MGGVSWLAQCALDFLIEELCHACHTDVLQDRVKFTFAAKVTDTRSSHAEASALAAPVIVFSLGSFKLTTRLLCDACAAQVKHWPAPVTLAAQDALSRVYPLSRIYPAFVTDERLLVLIHLLKFARRERIAPWLAAAMAEHLPDFSESDGVVVPVPMERRARLRRGFNQAEKIARALAASWELRLETRALMKVHATRAQSTLGRAERLVNVEGAFHADSNVVRNLDIILVDDLVTTGATLGACAAALRAAGARQVVAVAAGYRDERSPESGRFPQS